MNNEMKQNPTVRRASARILRTGRRRPWRGLALALAGLCLAAGDLAGQEIRPFPEFRADTAGVASGELCLVNMGPAGFIEPRPSDYRVDVIIQRTGASDPSTADLVHPTVGTRGSKSRTRPSCSASSRRPSRTTSPRASGCAS